MNGNLAKAELYTLVGFRLKEKQVCEVNYIKQEALLEKVIRCVGRYTKLC